MTRCKLVFCDATSQYYYLRRPRDGHRSAGHILLNTQLPFINRSMAISTTHNLQYNYYDSVISRALQRDRVNRSYSKSVFVFSYH